MLNSSNLGAVVLAAILACGCVFVAESAQAERTRFNDATSALDAPVHRRPLSRREGAALRDFALAQPSALEPKPDCSHLMHTIFTAAGLDYPYANSFELYSGVPQFRRVKNPQPGDLIVWRGHVGLVVDPTAHSFYSSLGSGIQTDQYDNRYWRRRGTPRFYRYLTDGSDKTMLLMARAQAPRQLAPVASDRLLAELDAATAATSSESAEVEATTVSSPVAEPAPDFRVPESIPIVSSGVTPSREEVAQALSELTNASAGALRKPASSEPAAPVLIFDQLQVEKIRLRRDQGWADVRINSRLEISQGKTSNKARSEKQQWHLLRTDQGWVAVTPTDRVYVPADVGVQVLAEKLALLARDHKEDRVEQAKLARLLNTLLNRD